MSTQSRLLNTSIPTPSLAQHGRLKRSHLKNCVFCSPAESLVLKQTPTFQLMIEPFPIVGGHLLISSHDHLGCAGELTAMQCVELDALKIGVRRVLERKYGAVILYEHGRAGHCISSGRRERLCHHFHLHA